MDADRAVKVSKTDEEWKRQLTPEQYYVAREHGTERAFSNPLNNEKPTGARYCMNGVALKFQPAGDKDR
jgi:peptide-methionine (R)-S-oxide reductase